MFSAMLAFDYAGSAREIDVDGRLHVNGTVISMEKIDKYSGVEVPYGDQIGLDPEKLYSFYRPASELQAAMKTLTGIPLLDGHVLVNADDPQQDRIVGVVLGDAIWDPPFLRGSLIVWSGDAIRDIESGASSAISAGYRWIPTMEGGVFKGQPFDGRMTQLQFNHLALVPRGRIGPSAEIVGDEASPDWVTRERMALREFRRRLVAA